jgi:hypothetical protein
MSEEGNRRGELECMRVRGEFEERRRSVIGRIYSSNRYRQWWQSSSVHQAAQQERERVTRESARETFVSEPATALFGSWCSKCARAFAFPIVR